MGIEKQRRRASAREAKDQYQETAQDYIKHYEDNGWEHFTRKHCPEGFYDEVEAHFMATAYVEYALSLKGIRRAA